MLAVAERKKLNTILGSGATTGEKGGRWIFSRGGGDGRRGAVTSGSSVTTWVGGGADGVVPWVGGGTGGVGVGVGVCANDGVAEATSIGTRRNTIAAGVR